MEKTGEPSGVQPQLHQSLHPSRFKAPQPHQGPCWVSWQSALVKQALRQWRKEQPLFFRWEWQLLACLIWKFTIVPAKCRACTCNAGLAAVVNGTPPFLVIHKSVLPSSSSTPIRQQASPGRPSQERSKSLHAETILKEALCNHATWDSPKHGARRKSVSLLRWSACQFVCCCLFLWVLCISSIQKQKHKAQLTNIYQ